jgi:integrase
MRRRRFSFQWKGDAKQLNVQFHAIQLAAGVTVPCCEQRPHKCTDTCLRYGFHELRSAFATMNALNMTLEALQALMRHQSPLTTHRYINYARQMNPAVANLHVPDVLKLNAVS